VVAEIAVASRLPSLFFGTAVLIRRLSKICIGTR